MKKYEYEVGVDIQTLWMYVDAASKEEAEELGLALAIKTYDLTPTSYDIYVTVVGRNIQTN